MRRSRGKRAVPAGSVAPGARGQSDMVCRAMADRTRREILNLLRDRRQTVGELAGNFRRSRPAVFKDLRLLRSALTRRRGTSRHCALNAKPLQKVSDWLGDYRGLWSDTIESLKSYVEEKR